MRMEEAVRHFTWEIRSLSCMSLTCGDTARVFTAHDGVIDRAGHAVGEDTIYDLASLTKLFTALTAMRLWEDGVLPADVPVERIEPRFTGLHGATVDQILGYEVRLVTPERIDAQDTPEKAAEQLFLAEALPHIAPRFYSDIHAMVIGCVIERVTGLSLWDAFRTILLEPLGMTETWAFVPEGEKARCVECDGEHRIEGENRIVRSGVEKGTVHDPKARILMRGGRLYGHAGLFSTQRDMVRLCTAVLREKVVRRETLIAMSRNRMGRPLPEGGHTQYMGTLCFVRHPDQYYSEIPTYMSDQAIGLAGFTGHHISIDIGRGIFCLMLGNRVLDRLTVLIPPKGKGKTDYGLNADGTGTIRWTDGRDYISSVEYVHHKDAWIHQAAAEALGLAE